MASRRASTARTTSDSKTDLAIISGAHSAGALVSLAHAPEAQGGMTALQEAQTLAATITAATLPIAVDLAQTFREMRDKIEQHYAKLSAPFSAAVKNLREMKAADLQPWQQADGIIGQAIILCRQRIQREAQQEADRLQRARQAAADKAAKEAADLQALLDEIASEQAGSEAGDGAAALLAEMPAEAPARVIVPYVPPPVQDKMDGLMERRDYSASAVDLERLVNSVAAGHVPLEALLPNQTWLNKQAGEKKVEGEIFPGVIGVCTIVLVRRSVGK